MTEDLLSAFFAQNMVVPTTKQAWEQFRMDIADSAALLFTPTYIDSVESIANPLDLPVSLLVRDMQPREYDFIVNIDSSGVHPFPPQQILSFSSCHHQLPTSLYPPGTKAL